jgi:hypothetical protein
MRKISKVRSANSKDYNTIEGDGGELRPLRVQGATITSWHGLPEIDLTALFAKPAPGASIAGAASASLTSVGSRTISLSDGTHITFANVS